MSTKISSEDIKKCSFFTWVWILMGIWFFTTWLLYAKLQNQTIRYYIRITTFYASIFLAGALSILGTLITYFLNYGAFVPMKILKFICSFWLDIDVEVRGLENLADLTSYVIISNHQSSLDVYVMSFMWPKNCTPLVKSSLKYIPFFNISAILSNTVFVNRFNKEDGKQAVNQAVETILHRKLGIWVFPEGTRFHEHGMLPFKKGAFNIAVQAQIPIVPVVISDYSPFYSTNQKYFKNNGKIVLEILKPVDTKGLKQEDVGELSGKIREQMLLNYEIVSAEAEKKSLVGYLLWNIPMEFHNPNQIISSFDLEEARRLNEDDLANPDSEQMFSTSKVLMCYALLKTCIGNQQTRRCVYELSRPGCYPRNWDFVYKLTFFYIKFVAKKLELATPRLTYSQTIPTMPNSSSARNLFQSKEKFFVPPTMKNLLHKNSHSDLLKTKMSGGGDRKQLATDFGENPIRFFGKLLMDFFGVGNFLNRNFGWVTNFDLEQFLCGNSKDAQTISFQQTAATLFMLRALTSVVVHSVEEDEYGLIQRNLSHLIKNLVHFSNVMHIFMRSNSLSVKRNESNVCILEEEAACSLKEIGLKFGDKIKLLNLNENELEVLQNFVLS